MTWDEFATIIARHAGVAQASRADGLFDGALGLSSVAFLEFILDLEETTGADIDVDRLDASIVTAGQLHDRLFGADV